MDLGPVPDHCLRHTFASLLLQQGESPAYVQRQLGHASIQLTVDTYRKWLPMGNKPAVNRLDEPSASKVVAKKESEVPDTLETSDSIGGPSRTRTLDPLIIDLCINNRHQHHKKDGNSEPAMNERMRSGRLVTCLVIRQSVAMSSSTVAGWPLASFALKCAQTHSSGLSSGA